MMRDHKQFVLGSAQNAAMVQVNENSSALFAGINSYGYSNPYEIVMVLKHSVLVFGSYADEFGKRSSEFDEIGQCLIEVPNDQVTFVYTEKDAEAHWNCVNADMEMLENAY
jgi:hypothetical protein